MNTWIFYFIDSLNTMTAVAGTGTNRAEGEVDARAKWAALVAGRSDNTERSPIVDCIDSGLTTTLSADNMPGLIL